MEFIKKNNIYIKIFIISLFLMLLSAIYETNIFYISKEFIFNSEYRENFANNSDILIDFNLNLINVVKYVLTNYKWKYNYMVIFGTNVFQLLIPIFASISALIFYKQSQSINKFIINKKKTYKSFLAKKIMQSSLKMSCSIFFAFIIFYILCIIISNGSIDTNISRSFLLDILGKNFYSKHTMFYYFIDGSVKLFLTPLIYCIFACSLSLILKSFKQVFLAPIIYYFGLTLVSFILRESFGVGMYLSPLLIMITGDFLNINTLKVMIMPSVAILISIIIITMKGKYVEI